jgi:hypothetical protein
MNNVNYEAPYCVIFSILLLICLVNINLGTLHVDQPNNIYWSVQIMKLLTV